MEELIERLQRYSKQCLAERLDYDFAEAVIDAITILQMVQATEKLRSRTNGDCIRSMTDEDRELPRWIPVDERLPEENVCVLVWGGYFAKVMETAILDEGLFYSAWDNRTEMFGVTHWMPPPEPPKEN